MDTGSGDGAWSVRYVTSHRETALDSPPEAENDRIVVVGKSGLPQRHAVQNERGLKKPNPGKRRPGSILAALCLPNAGVLD
jgi:hypothetical protein